MSIVDTFVQKTEEDLRVLIDEERHVEQRTYVFSPTCIFLGICGGILLTALERKSE